MRFLAALTIAKAAERQHDMREMSERDRARATRPRRIWSSR